MRALHTPQEAARWLESRVTGSLHCDSRKVGEGDGFIAWPGAATDGRRHVHAALAQGAAACVVEGEGVQAFGLDGEAVATFAGLKAATGPIASAFYGDPSGNLDVLAITGTNGKTSTAWWMSQALSNLERTSAMPCGLVGTLGIGIPPVLEFNGLTTPDPVLLQHHLRRFADAGVRACAIEASSVGIAERRLDGTRIRLALFTNFSQDHLDYHGTMDAYWSAKAELFDWPGLQAAVINVDDARGAALAKSLEGGRTVIWTFACTTPARLRATDIDHDDAGLAFTLTEGTQSHAVRTQLVGRYNVYNLLGVLAAMRALDIPLVQAVGAIAHLRPVPGRMERISLEGAPLVAVDYAHTPDALDQALQALRPLAARRGGRLWCVFGCGGDRDATKRPLMAAVAQRRADQVVLTSDNPRSERPEVILSQMLLGLSDPAGVTVEVDRARAIAQAVAEAGPNDVVLVAGKGHEAYQEVAGLRLPFSDQEHARAALQARRQPA